MIIIIMNHYNFDKAPHFDENEPWHIGDAWTFASSDTHMRRSERGRHVTQVYEQLPCNKARMGSNDGGDTIRWNGLALAQVEEAPHDEPCLDYEYVLLSYLGSLSGFYLSY